MDSIAIAYLPGEAPDLVHACNEGVVHPGTVRHGGGGEVGRVDHLGDSIIPGVGALDLALGTRTLGFIVEQLELRRRGAPALLQCAGEFVAAGEVDGGK